MEYSPASAVADAIEMLAGPALLHCVHSRPGAAVAARVLAQGSAKQRKRTIKAMKGAESSVASPNVWSRMLGLCWVVTLVLTSAVVPCMVAAMLILWDTVIECHCDCCTSHQQHQQMQHLAFRRPCEGHGNG